jgi:hypothetical protein
VRAHACMHACTHARTRARTHARTHTRTHTRFEKGHVLVEATARQFRRLRRKRCCVQARSYGSLLCRCAVGFMG